MKTFLVGLAMFCLLIPSKPGIAQSDIPYTASELLEKAIRAHDPEGKWNTYSGQVKLNTSFPDGNTYGTEIFEINVADDFYKCTRLAGEMKVVKGVKDGKIFRSVNGKSNLTQEEIDLFGLNDPDILLMKDFHYFHFGKLLHYKTLGADLQEKVTTGTCNGKACYQLTFTGDAAKVKNPAFAMPVVFNIDKETFALLGINWSPGDENWGYEVYEGYLDVNGIKLPRARLYYSNKDNSMMYIDFFTRADDNFSLPERYQIKSQATANANELISTTQLVKLDNKDLLLKMNSAFLEFNEAIAEMGFPECGYVMYEVLPGYETGYTHILEGWWQNQQVYDQIHNHERYKALWNKYADLNDYFKNTVYFRVKKVIPKAY
jgi:hypothetical protein